MIAIKDRLSPEDDGPPRSGGAPLAFSWLQAFDCGPPQFVADGAGNLLRSSARLRVLAAEIPDLLAALDLRDLAATLPACGPVTREIRLRGGAGRCFRLNCQRLDATGSDCTATAPAAFSGWIEEIDAAAVPRRELALSQERLNDVTRLVSDWVWETDSHLALTLLSARVSEMLDYHPRELIGRSFDELGSFEANEGRIAPDLLTRRPQPFRDIPYRITRRDGAKRLLRLSGLPMFCPDTGAFAGYRGTARDVTVEVAAWERVAESQSRLATAIESVSEGFALYDPENRLILCNTKYRAMLPSAGKLLQPGGAYEAIIGKAAAEGDVRILPASTAEWVAAQLAQRGLERSSCEWQLGDGRWIKVSERKAVDGSIVGISTDITELKRREEALFSAKETAEHANRTKSEFLANVSHELRTPLNAIIGFAEIIRDEIFGAIGSRQYSEYIGDILDSARHLLAVINDILDIAKAEAGKLELDEEDVDIFSVIRSATRLVQERAHRSQLMIDLHAPGHMPTLYADERKLKQILINLLTNSIKFTPEGGRIDIIVAIEHSGDFLLKVADTGIGIAEEDIATALTPFGQVDGSLTRKYEGTGLGLPLCQAMIELHGGTMSLESRVGAGTTVAMRLPAARLRSVLGLVDCAGG